MSSRSTNPEDYQSLSVDVAVMQKRFPSDFVIASHSHRRDQLIYAATGTMRVRTTTHSWIVPTERALYMPGGIEHAVAMRNPVEMRTLYIEPKAHRQLLVSCVVITPSPLLRELIGALLEEPENYGESSRGNWIAQLILEEICHGKALDLSIPMPTDARLLRVCEHVIDNPGETASLADYSELAIASERTLARICQRE